MRKPVLANEPHGLSAGATHQDIGTGTVIYKDGTHLHGPLGLVLAPNGDLITSNGDAVNNLTKPRAN